MMCFLNFALSQKICIFISMSFLFSSGSNSCSQLGIPSFQDSNTFIPVPLSNDIKVLKISGGSQHTLLLSEDLEGRKEVWITGRLFQEDEGWKIDERSFRKLDIQQDLFGDQGEFWI